ncbi:MAG TPA: hypothetical protein VGS10_23480 [Terracidiphilus sp.]|nr:hypothetical protein [Terracidiphilus sp.]
MTKHRESYWKTAVGSALLAVGGLAAIAWLAAEGILVQKPWPAFANLAWWAGGFLLLFSETVIVFILAGALICLHRDRLETRGVPYGLRPREWHGGFAVRGFRFLFRGLRALKGRRPRQLDLRAGELVEIRSLDEILATLDDRGERDSLPFMPEMQAWCGRQARVFRRVDKIFDWITSSGLRRMQDTVILEGLRCDGRDHSGCQADCPVLWKEAWLRRASKKRTPQMTRATGSASGLDLRQFTTRIDPETSETRFVCQLSRLPEATAPTSWNDPRSLFRELLTGNVRPGHLFTFVAILVFNSVQRRVGGVRFPVLACAQLQKTPQAVLNLQPGELVRVKSKHEIEQTLNAQFKNRGLWFDKEMTRFCGGTYKVRARVERQIDERTGKMMIFNTPCITLEGVTATGEYFEFAPLDERIYWREIWLDRMTAEDA